MTDFLEQLNTVLGKFNAETVGDITERYHYHPDYVGARLGAGSYGEAFRMRSATNAAEPIRVVKVIPKSRVSRNALQIQHLAAELAVTGFFTHQHLNKRVGLFHNSQNIFLVLELVGGATPDARTRLLYLFAHNHPRRLQDFDTFYASLEEDAKNGGFASVEDYIDRTGRMRTIMAECGVKREVPASTDLFNLIVAMRRVPDGLSRLINKQALLGLQHLHENSVVHRDIKTENVVVGIDRTAELLYDDDAKTRVRGVRISERVQAKLIDFGLVKYMHLGEFPPTFSPGMLDPSKAPPGQGQGGDLAALGAKQDLGFDSDDDDAGAAAKQPQGQQEQQQQGGGESFPVKVTPCGTELYCSLEVINGIIKSGVGRSKWMSDSAALPKMDVYGVGTMMFCCANGRPPFRPPKDPYRTNISREERIRQVQRLVAAGPIFSAGVAPATQEFVEFLMQNDPAKRPTTAQALAHPYLASVTGHTYSYEISLDGTVTTVTANAAQATPTPVAATPAASAANDSDVAADDDVDADDEDVLAAALRGKEDNGDTAGKNDDSEPAAPPPSAATATTTGSGGSA